MNYRFWSSCLLIVLIDQLIKWWVRSEGWYFVINSGASFSFGYQWPWFEWLVWGAFVVLLVLSIRYQVLSIKNYKLQITNYKQIPNTKYQILNTISWALIFGGAISNLIDRLLWGGVVDYLKFWQFPVFNLADVAITIGTALLIIPSIVLVYNKTNIGKTQHNEK